MLCGRTSLLGLSLWCFCVIPRLIPKSYRLGVVQTQYLPVVTNLGWLPRLAHTFELLGLIAFLDLHVHPELIALWLVYCSLSPSSEQYAVPRATAVITQPDQLQPVDLCNACEPSPPHDTRIKCPSRHEIQFYSRLPWPSWCVALAMITHPAYTQSLC